MAKLEGRIHLLKDAILAKRLNVFDCLEHYGLEDIWDGTRREQQIKCPGFHGDDRRKSARIYENGTMFCWACDSAYDIFAFEMKFTGQTFVDVIYKLADRYGIEYENIESSEDSESSRRLNEVKDLFKSFEKDKPKKRFQDYLHQVSAKLVAHREHLALTDYQRYWYVIDQLEWRVSSQLIPADQAIVHLENVYKEAVIRRA